ncbi:MAG: hypothetical protein KA419_16515 [Acidobacteria bacterium]|nr:hypothetical protein [Acidobacteriota bacterium]
MSPGIRLFSLVLLLITYGVHPAYQILHLKFADHAHTFCFVHDQIENVYPGQGGGQGPDQVCVGQDGSCFRKNGPGEIFRGNPHQACDSLNQFLDTKSLTGEPHSLSRVPVPASPLPGVSTSLFSPSCPLVLVSPKHSPPALLS